MHGRNVFRTPSLIQGIYRNELRKGRYFIESFILPPFRLFVFHVSQQLIFRILFRKVHTITKKGVWYFCFK